MESLWSTRKINQPGLEQRFGRELQRIISAINGSYSFILWMTWKWKSLCRITVQLNLVEYPEKLKTWIWFSVVQDLQQPQTQVLSLSGGEYLQNISISITMPSKQIIKPLTPKLVSVSKRQALRDFRCRNYQMQTLRTLCWPLKKKKSRLKISAENRRLWNTWGAGYGGSRL